MQQTTSNHTLTSIIIPVYNHAQYVGDAINSVLRQQGYPCEIIVVDDGSTDHTHAVVAPYVATDGGRVRYLRQENQGLSAARNTGIRAANGNYIGVLDADDMYEEDFLSSLVSILADNPAADGIYCGYQFVDEQNNLLPQRETRLIPEGQLYGALAAGNFLVPESILVRRACYERVGLFDETLSACEDWDMWLRIAKEFNLIGTSQVLTRHRILPGSMSTDPTRMFTNRLAVLRKHFGPATPGSDEMNPLKQRAYGRGYLTSTVEYLQFRDQVRAYQCFREMAANCPRLLLELDTFYQLGCGNQPKGSLGDFGSVDVEDSAQTLLEMLETIFIDLQLANRVAPYRRPAHAYAYLALGLLSYGARRYGLTRHFLLRGITTGVRYGLNRQAIVTLVKSLPGINLLVKQRMMLAQSN